jgi:hypothetical protein
MSDQLPAIRIAAGLLLDLCARRDRRRCVDVENVGLDDAPVFVRRLGDELA